MRTPAVPLPRANRPENQEGRGVPGYRPFHATAARGDPPGLDRPL